jgi:GntR family transcriptional regulator
MPPPSLQQQPHFVTGATALYAQLASVLRSSILSGQWTNGAAIPSIEELCATYGLGRVTVRQALQILSDEGLISSQRGRRTHVTHMHEDPSGKPLFSSIASIDHSVPNYSVRVLTRASAQGLPPGRWPLGQEIGSYMHIRKLDLADNQSYAVSSIYIAEDLYKRFPKNSEASCKLAQLAAKYAKSAIALARERLTVEPADFQAAEALGYPMAAPVARSERVFCDSNDRVIYYGVSIYRGDRFGLERDISANLQSPS